MLLRPLPKKGKIAITSPASTPDKTKLDKGITYLENRGYTIVVGESCQLKTDYLAGDDAIRANELLDFVDDDSIDAIFCARGGFGSMRILNMLDYELIKEKRKLIAGFSDITALQWAIYQECGLPSISGMMPAVDFCSDSIPKYYEDQFWDLFQNQLSISLPMQYNHSTPIKGKLLPGTLSIAAKLLGTRYFPDTSGHIIVFEDVGEPQHKIEGYLMQFNLAGVLQHTSALMLGTFISPDNQEYESVPDNKTLYQRCFSHLPVPLITDIPYGHIDSKLTLPLGTEITLSIDSVVTLNLTEPLFDL